MVAARSGPVSATQVGRQKDGANQWSKNYCAEGQFWEVAFELYEWKSGSCYDVSWL